MAAARHPLAQVLLFLLISLPVTAWADMTCHDDRGNAVAMVIDHYNAEYARAKYDAVGRAMVVTNPSLLQHVDATTRRYLRWRECAHHALGFAAAGYASAAATQQADCWAIRQMMRRGESRPEDLHRMQMDLNYLALEDWTRIPGVPRTIALKGCL